MSATLIELPHQMAPPTPIGRALRTRESAFRRLEHLHAEGRLPTDIVADIVIVDASKTQYQREFVRSLRENVADIILDTKAADLARLGDKSGQGAL